MAAISQSERFDRADIEAELDRILNSETFSRSERSRELLRYVVERDLNGEADRLKGFSIALDVFDREDSFDPSTDAVVRVQAGRLRDLLDTYYAGEGSQDAIRISIPRGSYVPAYECPACEKSALEAEEASVPAETVEQDAVQGEAHPVRALATAAVVPTRSRWAYTSDIRIVWTGLFLLFLLLAGNGWFLYNSGMAHETARAATAPLTAALAQQAPRAPSAYLPSIAIANDVPGPLKASLEDAITRFSGVIYRMETADDPTEFQSDFYFRAVAVGENSHYVQLFHRASGILVGADQVPGGLDAERMKWHIARITSRFMSVGGVAYAFLESEGRLNPLTECLVLASAYFNEQTAERHKAAYQCHEDLLADGINSSLVYANLASLATEVVTDHYDWPRNVGLTEALAFGRRAIELSPGSPESYRSMAWALQVSGEIDAALDMIGRANELNPYDLSIAASYGNTLIATGDFAGAVQIMERVVKASPVHPTWWDFATFLAAFQEDRYDLVALSSRNLVGHTRSHYCAARLIAAHQEGDEDLRARMLEMIEKRHDSFFKDPAAFYARILPPDAARKIVSALQAAGMPDLALYDG